MSNALIPVVFTHPLFGEVRTVQLSDELWFVAADIARILDHGEAAKLTRNIKREYRGLQIVETPGGAQQMSVISTPGLFHALMNSRKVQAAPFQKWVLGEVLPGIARDGAYIDSTNQMGETMAEATGGAIHIAVPAIDHSGPMVEVSLRLLKSLEQELVASRIERRQMMQVFSRTVGRMVRLAGVQHKPKKQTDPDRPFSSEETARAEMLFLSGFSGREVARRINRSHAAVAKFMAQRPDVLTASSLF